MNYLHINGLNTYLCLQGGWENQLRITWLNFYMWWAILTWNMRICDEDVCVDPQGGGTRMVQVPSWYFHWWMGFLQEKFTNKWENTQDIFLFCTVFSINKKHENDTVLQFNARFFIFYNWIPYRVRPNEVVALIYYIEAFDGIFGIFLKNEEPQNLDEAQATAINFQVRRTFYCNLRFCYDPWISTNDC